MWHAFVRRCGDVAVPVSHISLPVCGEARGATPPCRKDEPDVGGSPAVFAGAFRCHVVGMALNLAETFRLILQLLQVGRESFLVLAFGFGFALQFLR